MNNKKERMILALCLIFSYAIGSFYNDLLIGGTILFTGLSSAYYAGIGKRATYILGFINYALIAYVSWQNYLYGIFIFYVFLFAPLQIAGFFSWKNALGSDDRVNAKKFTLNKAIAVVALSSVCSVVLGYGLSFVPNQQLSYLDATTNCINLFGVILMIMRYAEAFWLWLINNVLDLAIWAIILLRDGEGAFMMFCTSVGFLLINIYGIIKWYERAKRVEQ
jgi:nicotinamide mononucleotide transporter